MKDFIHLVQPQWRNKINYISFSEQRQFVRL
jgi:hypothetical protein